ncbi:hypothetical protein DAETH_39330 (plasmid) [Deinococcus aetherius]|uniref:Uncharacterized protein n=1 Tax=Deinococcus aetherius TaxID=200252 RepID=A0ABN6RQ04_9DEIO|nr:hypothetical protein [Deinococcus aetherius]BDP43964.1 hypothetical protein DAETH_39330 [Deinococcus aetherius]
MTRGVKSEPPVSPVDGRTVPVTLGQKSVAAASRRPWNIDTRRMTPVTSSPAPTSSLLLTRMKMDMSDLPFRSAPYAEGDDMTMRGVGRDRKS